VDGNSVPSSECDMHRILYKYRTDVNAVITPMRTLPQPFMLKSTAAGGTLFSGFCRPDVRCAPYASYGTVDLAKNAFEAMKDRKACLLANHGLLAAGVNLAEAFAITETIEFCCELYYRAKSIGEPVILPEEEMLYMMERFKDYGKPVQRDKNAI